MQSTDFTNAHLTSESMVQQQQQQQQQQHPWKEANKTSILQKQAKWHQILKGKVVKIEGNFKAIIFLLIFPSKMAPNFEGI